MDHRLASALTYLRAATDIVKDAVQARDDDMIDKAIGNMNDRLEKVQEEFLALQEQQVSLSQSERNPQDGIRELEKQGADFENYILHRPALTSTMCRPETPMAAAQVPVESCANCMADGVQTFLKPIGGDTSLRCHIHGIIPSDNKPPKVEIKQTAPRWSRKW